LKIVKKMPLLADRQNVEKNRVKTLFLFFVFSTLWNAPAFSQGSVGDPPSTEILLRIPDDDSKVNVQVPQPEVNNRILQLKKDKEFAKISKQIKAVSKKLNSNAMRKCHQENPNITGIKSLVIYLVKKESHERLKKTVDINKQIGTTCKIPELACVFQGALNDYSKLIHQPTFVAYLTEVKGWKKEDAEMVTRYLVDVEVHLKAKP
jgi:hypothetical protein